MSVLVVGISHKSAPVSLLERVALDSDGVNKLLGDVVTSTHVTEAAVIATPAAAAQDVADRMVESGITSILNFAPIVLSVPANVDVRKVDLSIELQILAYHEQRKGASA